jgi:hypothetical protein
MNYLEARIGEENAFPLYIVGENLTWRISDRI